MFIKDNFQYIKKNRRENQLFAAVFESYEESPPATLPAGGAPPAAKVKISRRYY
jgi:hypothetical protein